jgi:thymidylate kinase
LNIFLLRWKILKGKLIVIEASDGSGKVTQTELFMKSWLKTGWQ